VILIDRFSPEGAGNAIRLAWLALFSFWMWNWRSVKRAEKREPMTSRLSYSLVILLGFLAMVKPLPVMPGGLLLARSPDMLAVAVAMNWAGILFAIWARIRLGTNWSAVATLREGHELVRGGPYRLTRHPIYTGMLVAAAGVALLADRWQALIGFGLVFLGFWIKSRKEERLMEERFGAEYQEYRRHTKSLIPGMI
jgi:protein-S-isoprenylcysteine O-methyltransferase Ste14